MAPDVRAEQGAVLLPAHGVSARRRAARLAVLAVALIALTSCAQLRIVARGGAALEDAEHFAQAPVRASSEPRSLAVGKPLASDEFPWMVIEGFGRRIEGDWPELMRKTATRAFLIYRDGALVFEWYDRPQTAGQALLGHSLSKPVVSLLLAMAHADGAIASLDDSITRYLPNLADADPRWSAVTLRQLDDMRQVIAGPGDREAPITMAGRLYLSLDLVRMLRQFRPVDDPSTVQAMRYHSASTQLVALAIEAATGERLDRYFARRLWQPMGAEAPALWNLDREGGAVKAFCCLSATARDWIRFGALFLEPSPPLVPAETRNTLASATRGDKYRAGWFVDPSSVKAKRAEWARCLGDPSKRTAWGYLGQTLIVHPDQRWVAVRLGERGEVVMTPALATMLACDLMGTRTDTPPAPPAPSPGSPR